MWGRLLEAVFREAAKISHALVVMVVAMVWRWCGNGNEREVEKEWNVADCFSKCSEKLPRNK